jgi:hypothetical protein
VLSPSQPFGNLFNAYAQAIKRAYQRCPGAANGRPGGSFVILDLGRDMSAPRYLRIYRCEPNPIPWCPGPCTG